MIDITCPSFFLFKTAGVAIRRKLCHNLPSLIEITETSVNVACVRNIEIIM